MVASQTRFFRVCQIDNYHVTFILSREFHLYFYRKFLTVAVKMRKIKKKKPKNRTDVTNQRSLSSSVHVCRFWKRTKNYVKCKAFVLLWILLHMKEEDQQEQERARNERYVNMSLVFSIHPNIGWSVVFYPTLKSIYSGIEKSEFTSL